MARATAPTEAKASISARSASSKGSVRLRPETPSQSVRSARHIGSARPSRLGPLGCQRGVRRTEQRPGRGQHGGGGLLDAHGPVDLERGVEEATQSGPVMAGIEVARAEIAQAEEGQEGHGQVLGVIGQQQRGGNGNGHPCRQVTSNLPLMPPETVRRQGVPSVAMIVTMAPVSTTKSRPHRPPRPRPWRSRSAPGRRATSEGQGPETGGGDDLAGVEDRLHEGASLDRPVRHTDTTANTSTAMADGTRMRSRTRNASSRTTPSDCPSM